MSRAVLVDFVQKNYVAGKAMVVAAGRVNHRQTVRAVRRYSRQMNSGAGLSLTGALENQGKPEIRLITRKTEQTQITLGIRTCSRHDDRRYALRLLNTILGENMSSRLFQVIREDRGLAYSIYSSPSFFEDTGDLVVSAGLDTGNVSKTLALVMGELRRLRSTPAGAAELTRAKDYVIGQMDLSLEGTDNQMNWVGEQWLGYGKVLSPVQVRRRLHEVTSRQIQTVACDFFRPERMNLALVSPLKSAQQLQKLLER
jgi:predicted Zn-dependent peptidase